MEIAASGRVLPGETRVKEQGAGSKSVALASPLPCPVPWG